MNTYTAASLPSVLTPTRPGSDALAHTDASPQPLGRLVSKVIDEFNELKTGADIRALLYHRGPVQPKDLLTHGFRLCDSPWARQDTGSNTSKLISSFIRQIQLTRRAVDAIQPTFDAIAFSGARASLQTVAAWVEVLEEQRQISPLPAILAGSENAPQPFSEVLRRYDQSGGLVAQVQALACPPEDELTVLQQIEETGLRASLTLCALQAFCARKIRDVLSDAGRGGVFRSLSEFRRAELNERVGALNIWDTFPGGEAFTA